MENYIQIQDLHKTYMVHHKPFPVLKGIDLSVRKGEIFGIIGFSGAGKSTLARCINRLETPDSGSIMVDGTDMLKLSGKELRKQRSRICMVFQNFNLF